LGLLYAPAVLALEFFHAAGGIDVFLLAGEEGVALRADFDGDLFLGRTGLPGLAATAGYRRFDVLGVNALFHDLSFATLRSGTGHGGQAYPGG